VIITAKPIKYNSVNSFEVVERIELVQGNGGTYYVQLFQGSSRYLPAAGATVQLLFPRAKSVAATPANQDTTVSCTAIAQDASLYSFVLSSAQVDKIVSDGAKLLITESGVTKTWPVDHLVRRRSNAPGA
jgi:hypothetical protein